VTRSASFKFTRVLTPVGFSYLPIAEVEIRFGRRSVRIEMTVDSGADLVMIPRYVGHDLGLSLRGSAVRNLAGIGGGVPYVLKRVKLGIGSIALDARIAWAQRDDVPALLGRMDVFDRLRITFDGKRRDLVFAE
jgi:hypothetical protein